ncbi:MAG: DegV family protein [Syntrophomonadaceae bacterium]|nr:DegV family protein [Syntrophomonadaceae bacterium]
MAVKIVSDNCCDLPLEIIKDYDIRIVNMVVRFGDREYKPGELTAANFYEKMTTEKVMPQTSQPSTEEMMHKYSEALQDGSEVIGIHFTSRLSGTMQSAQIVAQTLENDRLHIFDSRKASLGQGLIVLEAARMAKNGEPVSSIIQVIEAMRENMQCIFSVQNIKYLISGGRISKGKGMIAGALDIKPILAINEEGLIISYDRVHGHRAALKKLLDIMEIRGVELSGQTIGISHASSMGDAEFLRDGMIERFGPREIIIGDIGPVIGSHVGPGTFAVFFQS